eukprot:5324874-Amphidinium_carterae.1
MGQDIKASWVQHWGCRCLYYLAAHDADAVYKVGGFETIRSCRAMHLMARCCGESTRAAPQPANRLHCAPRPRPKTGKMIWEEASFGIKN